MRTMSQIVKGDTVAYSTHDGSTATAHVTRAGFWTQANGSRVPFIEAISNGTAKLFHSDNPCVHADDLPRDEWTGQPIL